MRKGYWVWITWLVSTLTSFAVLETLAVRARRFPPLTWVLRWLLGLQPRCCYGRFLLACFAGLWAWLCWHLGSVLGDEFPEFGVDTQALPGVDSESSK